LHKNGRVNKNGFEHFNVESGQETAKDGLLV